MTFPELTPDDRNFFDPVKPEGWVTGSDGVFTEGTVDEAALAEADQGQERFTPPGPEDVVYEGRIDEAGKVHYVREDVARAEASREPYAVVAPVPDALFMHGEPLPRELTDRLDADQHKHSTK